MKWHPTPVKGVYTGTHKGTPYALFSLEALPSVVGRKRNVTHK